MKRQLTEVERAQAINGLALAYKTLPAGLNQGNAILKRIGDLAEAPINNEVEQ